MSEERKLRMLRIRMEKVLNRNLRGRQFGRSRCPLCEDSGLHFRFATPEPDMLFSVDSGGLRCSACGEMVFMILPIKNRLHVIPVTPQMHTDRAESVARYEDARRGSFSLTNEQLESMRADLETADRDTLAGYVDRLIADIQARMMIGSNN